MLFSYFNFYGCVFDVAAQYKLSVLRTGHREDTYIYNMVFFFVADLCIVRSTFDDVLQRSRKYRGDLLG